MINCTLTNHALYDRKNRLTYIQNTIGFGDVILAEKVESDQRVMQLTDTGVMLVRSLRDPDRPLITAYIAGLVQAVEVYQAYTDKYDLPKYLRKKIDRNQRFRLCQPEN